MFKGAQWIKQAYDLQKKIEKAQKELENRTYSGKSGCVEVRVNGKNEIVSLDLGEFSKLDIKELEKLVMVSMNDAIKKAKEDSKETMRKVSKNTIGANWDHVKNAFPR